MPDSDGAYTSTDVDASSMLAKLSLDDPDYIAGFSQTDVDTDAVEVLDYSRPISATAELHDELFRIIINFPYLELCAFADDVRLGWHSVDMDTDTVGPTCGSRAGYPLIAILHLSLLPIPPNSPRK